MKKRVTVLLTCLFVMILAACSNVSDRDSSKQDHKTHDISAEEIFNKAMERQNNLKSVSTEIAFNEKVVTGEGDEKSEMPSSGTLKIDRIVNPETFYAKGKISSYDVESEEKIDTDFEMYVKDHNMYLKDSYAEENLWVKFSEEEMSNMLGAFANDLNSAELLKKLEPFIRDFQVEEQEDVYLLTLTKASDTFTNYLIDHMQLTNTLGLEKEEIEKAIKVDEVNYVIKMKKDTNDLLEISEAVNISFQFDDEPLSIKSDVNITYSDIDRVPNIEIPQEIIDHAVEIE